MPDYTLHHPKTDETTVTGDPAERARLRARGWRDATDATDATDGDTTGVEAAKAKTTDEKPAGTSPPASPGSAEPGAKAAGKSGK